MSLRLRLFLAFALLLAVLAALAAVGVVSLNRNLEAALGETAVQVGHSVVRVLRQRTGEPPAASGDGSATGALADTAGERHLRIVLEGEPGKDAAHEAAEARVFERQVQLRVDDQPGPPRLLLEGEGLRRSIPLPRAQLQQAIGEYSAQLAWGLAALFVLGLALAGWVAHRIAQPLRGLADSAQRLARGERGVQAPESGAREVRQTIAAFNSMSGRMAALDAEAAQLRDHRALVELGEIGRGLAHALRNPLHAAGLAVEELAAGPGSMPAAELAAIARAQLGRVDQALRGFLALAAGEDAEVQPVELRELAEDVMLEASQRSGDLVPVRLADGPPVWLPAVTAELRILLHTLVINAIEASRGRASAVEIEIVPGSACDPPADAADVADCADSPASACVRVMDRGGGVPAAIRARLFQPHVSSKPEGAGMGLYLAQRLAALRYGGDIAIADRTGGGTIVELRLGPRRAA